MSDGEWIESTVYTVFSISDAVHLFLKIAIFHSLISLSDSLSDSEKMVYIPAGYANEQLCPESNGFDHFYGFYQGAIDYVTKSYNDIENGDIGIYDFWEDGEPKYDVIDSDINTMTLYSQQIQMYIETESHKQKEVLLLLSSDQLNIYLFHLFPLSVLLSLTLFPCVFGTFLCGLELRKGILD